MTNPTNERTKPIEEQDWTNPEKCPWHDPERLETAWNDHGTVVDVARHFDIHPETARDALHKYGVREKTQYGSHVLEDLNPEEIGLSPLRDDHDDKRAMTDGGRSPENTHPDAGGS